MTIKKNSSQQSYYKYINTIIVYQTAWNIIRLKKDIDLAESISEKEITLAEKRHNLKTIVNDLLGVYEQIKRKNTDEI